MNRNDTFETVDLKPCPACPDGSVWNSNGPTGATCKTCKGHAVVHLNGSPLTKDEAEERSHD